MIKSLPKELVKSILDIIFPLITLFLGYYLGKRSWKKQFLLKHFDLHENVLRKLSAIYNDEIEGWYFKKTEQEIKQMLKDKKIISASEYVYDTKPNNEFPPNLAFESINDMLSDFSNLSIRSNKKISKITTAILKIYQDETEQLNSYLDNLDVDEDGISKEVSDYLDYLKEETEELVLLKTVPLINDLKIELSNYLKNKE